jgi:hypothetical protein
MGWGGFLDKLLGVLPIQKRKERWRNQIDNLRKERDALLKSKATPKKARRLEYIDKRIAYLQQLCKNA